MNSAIENYCDRIILTEKKNNAVSSFTQNLLGSRNAEPKDIENQSCAKLRNIAFAMSKIRELYKMMNVTAITKTVKLHKDSLANAKNAVNNATEDTITGAFKISVSYANNIKPTNKNGSCNPYVVVRVPEGTEIPPEDMTPTSAISKALKEVIPPRPTILIGNACELFRSRAIPETLNPNWDETFTVILPPVQRLEVAVFSKNLLTADEVSGTAIIDLSIGTKLRRKLSDHQTHDIHIELRPQGRLLLRLTMEGEYEDVDFWFRKTNERLMRTRDSFLRTLTDYVFIIN